SPSYSQDYGQGYSQAYPQAPHMPGMPSPRQLAAPQMGPGRSHLPGGPMSQMPGQWSQMGGQAPRAPYGPYGGPGGARRPGQSQVFEGGPSYPGSGGFNGGDDDPRNGRRVGDLSRIEWDNQ